jgi:hypothetical protein
MNAKISERQLALLSELGKCRVGCGLPMGALSRGDRAVLAALIRMNLAWKVGGDFATVAMITGDGRERLDAQAVPR